MSAAYDRIFAGYYNANLKTVANPGGLAGAGAMRVNWPLMLADLATVVSEAAASALTAASALGGATSAATSATNTSIPAVGGTMTVNVGAGKTLGVGVKAVIARTSAPTTTAAYGTISAYDTVGGNLSLLVEEQGSAGAVGPFADWTVGVSSFGVPKGRTLTAAGLVTGGGDLSANRTVTVTAASAAQVQALSSTTVAATPGAIGDSLLPQTLTDASTVNWNMAGGPGAEVTLGGNRTIATPTNPKKGVTYYLDVIQDGAGSRVPVLPSSTTFDFMSAGAPTFSTGAGKRDLLILKCFDAATPKFQATFKKAA